MLDDALKGITEEKWLTEIDGWTYADVIYHILNTQEFYIRDTPKGMKWGELYGSPELKNSKPMDYYPKKETLLKYLEEVKNSLRNYLLSIKDEDLYNSDGFKEHLSSIHKKLLYLLRHNAHHLGELALMHRINNLEKVEWE
jgi:uncharacterized damage-inducible protein DinB